MILLALWSILSSIVMFPVIQVEKIYFAVQGYQVANNYDDAHRLAKKILDNKLSPDECLDLKYVAYDPLKGFGGTGLNDGELRDTCLEEVAEMLKDPMVCTKMTTHYGAGTCVYDAGSFYLWNFDPDVPDHMDCWYNESTRMLDCHYNKAYGMPDRPDLKPEEFSIDECYKFTRKEHRDLCNSYLIDSIDDCDKQDIEYYREQCYLRYDQTCDKSAYPLLRESCKAYRIIDATIKY